jgi:benzoylformate decarboxylase
MTNMTGSRALIEILLREEVEYVFGIPGSTEVLFMDALEDHPELQYVLGLHETVAVGMADGYARVSGKVGFVNLHTAPGLASGMAMLINACAGGAPLVITAGQQDTRLFMQEPDLTGDLKTMASPYVKWSTEVLHVADLPIALRRAFKVAKHPPTGPVFVSLPQNIMAQTIDLEYEPSGQDFTRLRPDREVIGRAVELLLKAKTPSIIVGSGVAKYEAVHEVVRLAEITGARVYHTWASDVNFPTSHHQFLGDLRTSTLATRDILQSVDVLIVVGNPLFRQPLYFPEPLITTHTKIIQIDDDSREIAKNFPVAAGIEGNIKISLLELNDNLESKMPAQTHEAANARVKEIARQKEEMRAPFLKKAEEEWNNVPISVSRLMQELGASLKPGTIVVDDTWSSTGTLRRFIDFTEPGSYQRHRGGGSIGWGMPASLGVKLASPVRPVVAVCGDGGAIFSFQSLWTAAHYNLPVTYVICANASYGMVKFTKMLFMGEKVKGRFLALDLDNPRIDFCQIAQGLGVYSQKVEHPDELKDVFKNAFNLNKPSLVEVIMEDVA